MRGLGVDLTSVARVADLIDRRGGRFLARCFQPGEDGGDARHAAACWSAKEAFVKAVAPHGGGVGYRDVEVTLAGTGHALRLHGPAAAALDAAGAAKALVSLASTERQAVAVVVLV